ncbi:hypothetical protein ACTFIY_004982 [Dictyostelium cf. discoideum]
MNNINNDNIVFSGDGRGLPELLKRIKGDALEYVSSLAIEASVEDIIESLSNTYRATEEDHLSEVMKLIDTKFTNLEMEISKLVAKVARNAPETLVRAVEIARTIEGTSIESMGRYYGNYFQTDLNLSMVPNFGGQVQQQTPLLPQPMQTPLRQNVYVPQTPVVNGYMPQTPVTPYSAPSTVNMKPGHKVFECWKKKNSEKFKSEVRTIEEDEETVNAIGTNSISATLLVNGKNVRGLVDTGSSITVQRQLLRIKIIGYANAEVKIDRVVGLCKIDIVDDGDLSMDCIFGLNLINKLDLIIDTSGMKLFNKQHNVGVKLYYREFSQKICAIDYNYLNKLSPELKTNVYTTAYNTSPSDKEFIESYIKDALERGIIEKSKSSKFGSPIVLHKRNGKTRFCVNYKKLNSVTVKDKYPLPLVSDCWYYLRNIEVFTKLDLTQGYYQIKMGEEDREKTTFVSHMGEEMLRKISIVFIDDFIVFSRNKNKQSEDLRRVFELFKERKISVQLKNVSLREKKLSSGFKVSKDGITYDGSKFINLQQLPPPNNQKELMKLLGIVNYFRTFIKNFTSYTQPFFPLLKKNINFEWTEELEKCRMKLLRVLAETNVLSFPRDAVNNVIETDVSNNGIGGCNMVELYVFIREL